MFTLPITVSVKELWGTEVFSRDRWGPVNYLVGPNGTGKTKFAEELARHLRTVRRLSTRLVSAERLAGMYSKDYAQLDTSDVRQGLRMSWRATYDQLARDQGIGANVFLDVEDTPYLRIRLQATLSQLFGRSMVLNKDAGFLKPQIHTSSHAYDMFSGESHGLKELIILLAILLDDRYKCIVLDEPEAHLHPQLQAYLVQVIRSMAGSLDDPEKKVLFIVTHSPFMVDLRVADDVKCCLVFQQRGLPQFVQALSSDDEYKLARVLPKLNGHHKQMLFAQNPILVEGYTDRGMFEGIEERRGLNVGGAGVSFIDVGGKSEMDFYRRLARLLGLDVGCICDLDALLEGPLRQSLASDARTQEFLQSEGVADDLMAAIGDLESDLNDVIKPIEEALQADAEGKLACLHQRLASTSELKKQRLAIMTCLGDPQSKEALLQRLPEGAGAQLRTIVGRLQKICSACEAARVIVMQSGSLEHYLPSFDGDPYHVSDTVKWQTFSHEQEVLKNLDDSEIASRYVDLVALLDRIVVPSHVEHDTILEREVAEWVHAVQMAVLRDGIRDQGSLEAHAVVAKATLSPVWTIVEFKPSTDGFFCRIKLAAQVDKAQREITFDHRTVPAQVRLPPSGGTST